MESEDEDTSLDNIIKSRLHQIVNRINGHITEAEAYCKGGSDDEESVQKAQICAFKLENMIKRFTTELNEYFRTSNNPSPDEISDMSNAQLNGEEILAELKCRLSVIVDKNKKEIQSNKEHSRAFSAKLPTLTLPEFQGDVLTWCEFWDIYKSNIHDRPIPDVDKLLYLKSTLKGEPRRIIDGLETTNKNYAVAINILTDRYGKQTRIIDAHYSALGKIKVAGTPISDCRTTLNEIERHLRVLQSLGENTDHNHLRYLITEKFPGELIYEMKMKMKEDTVGEMRKQLEVIISAKEEANKIRQGNDPAEKGNHTVETLHVTHKNREQIRNKPARKYNDFKKGNHMKIKNMKREENKNENKSEPSQKIEQSYSRGQYDTTRKRKFETTRDKGKEQREGTKEYVEHKRRKPSCIFCGKDHFPDQCQEYRTIKERKSKLNKRCFNCLSENHIIRYCKSKKECVYCLKSGRHNRALCPEKFRARTETTLTAVNSSGFTILQTAIVTVKNERDHNKPVTCRLLLDSGSQRSYVTIDISKKLNLPVKEENRLSIFGFASEMPREYDSPLVKLEITTRKNKTITLLANAVPTITKGVEMPVIDLGKRKDITLADDGSLGERVDILVGNDYYFNLIGTEKIRLQDNLFLINSEFGWIISGRVNTEENENTLSVITYCQNHDPNCVYFTEPDLPLKNMDISFLWSMESIGITDNPKATREEEAIKHLNETIRYIDNRYMVKWPWIEYPPKMLTNFGLAYGRLKGLLQRLNENSMKEYQDILEEQLKKGIIEIINPTEDVYTQKVPPIHYLPHHMVKQEGKKGRIVYDASGKLKGEKSLNECMYKGPSMIGDLVALLIQFRTNKVAITADVEKAFLQIGLQTEDRDVTRFIWTKDESKPLSMDNIIHMRFCRVPFGIIASPFILTATLRYHITRKAPELISKIVDKCYVDNFVTGTDSTETAIQLFTTTREVFNEMNMNLRDWVSNDEAFLNTIPSKYKAKQTRETKILGLMWNIKRDTLRLNIKSESFKEENVREPQSKRKILSTIASMYDPCGLGSPLILPTKLLLQQLWETKIKWDTILPDELQRKWEDIIHRLEAIKEIEIPRYMGLTGEAVYELHGFSDASKQAYAAVIYLTVENEDQGNVSFVMAKSKVVPKEEREDLRMPRLELLGCYLGSKLMKYIKSVIGITIKKEYLWTDSKIVLSWVHSNKLLPPFIARRVNAIKENKQLELRYVNTELNPADLATRPDLWEKKKTLWLNGPEFLQQGKEKWPSHSVFKIQELSPGQGPSDTINLMEIDEKIPDKTFREENIPVDTVKIMKDLQKEYFPLESEGKKTSLATNLELFKDIDGLLRCNGRLKHADWSFDKRHPILIPRDCEFTNDLVMKIHRENYHMKANHTLSRVRESYWIPKGKSYIQRLLAKCPECVKQSGGPFKLPPAPTLPFERVNYSSPFTYTGVDYMGPLLINNGDGNSKRWICLFTCLVVRAIHLEVVQDLTAEEGLLALRRMISARGIPSLVTSDNAQHFKLIGEITSSQYCIDKKIRWRYIIPLSPWAGGFYERLIGIVKNCMKRTLGKHMLRDNQLTTIVKEIEAVVNSRPLTSVDSEPDHILKPSDFLTVGKVITVEESENESEPRIISTTKTDLIKGWKRALILLKEFKDMFSNRYLLSLRERYGHLPREPRITSKLKPSPGQIVQIKGDSKNRNDWKVGKITELIPSADGLCRAAKVQVGNSEYTRSIAHLYPLEIEDAPDPVTNICDIGETRPLVTPDIDTVNTEELEKIHPQVHESTTDEITQPQAIAPMSLMEDDHVSIQAEGEDNALTEKKDESLPNRTETNNIEVNQRSRRAAATKAIQKIKEWTRDLTALLLHSGALPPGSVASGANL